MRALALIVAAGRGSRHGGDIPKQYVSLAGEPVLRHSLRTFSRHPAIAGVRAVIHPDDRALYDRAAQGLRLLPPVFGGAARQESVLRGLESLASEDAEVVLIHDGARPLVSAPLIDGVLAQLVAAPGAIAAVPVRDTLKRGSGTVITDTVDRRNLWRAQTPQGFHYTAILQAHRAATGAELTDDAHVAERAGMKVALVEDSEDNLKITTPDDLVRAERILGAAADVRVGSGFDVHRFTAGDALTLCGVRIPHTHSLEGHSDADAGLHALTDALLGTIAAGDIGQHFSPSDPRWRGAESGQFLRFAADRVREKGGTVTLVDVTLLCEAPRIAPHRAAMQQRIAELLEIGPDRVSIKATTTEGLGFTGRREGIAAQATATVRFRG